MLRSRITLLAAATTAAAAVAAPTANAAQCTGADVKPTHANVRLVRHATLCLLNVQRRSHGLRALRGNRRLRHAASPYAHLMATHDFFSHQTASSTPLSRIRRTGYLRGARRWTVGENLAWGTGSFATPRQTVRGWMHSPGHRANILNGSFRHIGIGIAPGAPVRVSAATPGATYATDFGARS
jgi:uncharacterized protein YkwD